MSTPRKKERRPIPLKWEILFALVIKLILLYILWSLFFDQPMPKEERGGNTSRVILNRP